MISTPRKKPMPENEVAADLSALREDLTDLKRSLAKVGEALERLVRLEERHANTASALERAFASLAKIDTRVRALELAQPVQKLTSGWVSNAAWAAFGVLAMFVLKKAGVL